MLVVCVVVGQLAWSKGSVASTVRMYLPTPMLPLLAVENSVAQLGAW
jgi:hypothetical protein